MFPSLVRASARSPGSRSGRTAASLPPSAARVPTADADCGPELAAASAAHPAYRRHQPGVGPGGR
eukprot:10390251-Alexandrium_andersonii.AAC.1